VSVLDLTLLAGGTFFLVETIKALVPWALSSWSKHLWALSTAFGGAVVLDLPWRYGLVAVPGIAGLAALLHRTHRVFGAVGDHRRVEVLRAGAGRSRFH
jgi:hypothetical protein